MVKRGWEAEQNKPAAVSEPDKELVRGSLVEALIRAPPLIQSQLGEVFKAVVYCDYPEKWPGLLPALQANLASGEEARVHGSLVCLRILVRKYEFNDEEDGQNLNLLMTATLPSLLSIFQNLLASPEPSTQVATYLKLVLKIFWSATYMTIPTALLEPSVTVAWLGCIHALIMKPVPTVSARGGGHMGGGFFRPDMLLVSVILFAQYSI